MSESQDALHQILEPVWRWFRKGQRSVLLAGVALMGILYGLVEKQTVRTRPTDILSDPLFLLPEGVLAVATLLWFFRARHRERTVPAGTYVVGITAFPRFANVGERTDVSLRDMMREAIAELRLGDSPRLACKLLDEELDPDAESFSRDAQQILHLRGCQVLISARVRVDYGFTSSRPSPSPSEGGRT